MDVNELIDNLRMPSWHDLEDPDATLLADASDALSTLQAENEKLKRALAEMKKKPWSWRRRSSGQRYTEKVDGIWVVSCKYEEPPYPVVTQEVIDRLAAIEDILGDEYDLDRLRELVQADREGRCVVLNMPRKPLVWGDDDKNTCLCPYCGKDLMGIPYGERMVLQCPECGQYLDATKVITRAEAALRMEG